MTQNIWKGEGHPPSLDGRYRKVWIHKDADCWRLLGQDHSLKTVKIAKAKTPQGAAACYYAVTGYTQD